MQFCHSNNIKGRTIEPVNMRFRLSFSTTARMILVKININFHLETQLYKSTYFYHQLNRDDLHTRLDRLLLGRVKYIHLNFSKTRRKRKRIHKRTRRKILKNSQRCPRIKIRKVLDNKRGKKKEEAPWRGQYLRAARFLKTWRSR